ncbi:MAG: LysR family transcriptional regulator [Proteobacteria bacterium]|nr:MAG: LysR family transcriptional regulator [Pseudomonadota bacterium]
MDHLSHELNVLSRAVAHKNLSGASAHVGLSQPQLSRIIKKLEESLSIILLDRAAKRNATWTSAAYRLAEFYARKMRSFDRELEALLQSSQTRQLEIGTLEGLSQFCLPFIHHLLEHQGIRLVEVDVYDLDSLESRFARGQLDLIFTSREPGRRKFSYVHTLGHQSLEEKNTNPHFQLMSTFEYGLQKERLKAAEKVIISNSLWIRKTWLQKFGGRGTFPSEPRAQSGRTKTDTVPILLVGAETLSPVIWAGLKNLQP